jgi:hypothetical protein
MAATQSSYRSRELIREAVDTVQAVDAHAHNLVEIESDFPFLRCFSEAEGEALSFAPHSLSFKVCFVPNGKKVQYPDSLDCHTR